MTDSDPDTETPAVTADVTELVDRNGLVELFANRARARILAVLFYADEPLAPAEIADGASVYESVVREALGPLDSFDILDEYDGDPPRYELVSADDDELVAAVRRVAELATRRRADAVEES